MASNPEDFNRSGPRNTSNATDWSSPNHRIAIAASLVQGVYVMERDRKQNRQGLQALAPPWWNSFGFQVFMVLIDISDSSIYGVIYEFKSPMHPPQYVMALRGTVIKTLTMWQDFKLNFKIVVKQGLKNSSRVEQALKFVKELVVDAGPDNVWLAGHSLGSAIALTVGRKMVKSRYFLKTYLFNPPYISVPLEHIKNPTMKTGARILASLGKAAASLVLMNHQQRAQVEETFNSLSKWAPYLFVNRNDPICSEYIGYFQNRVKMARLGSAASRMSSAATRLSSRSILMCALGHCPEPFHLLPTAYLQINTSEAQCFREAHGVAQWWNESFDCQPILHTY